MRGGVQRVTKRFHDLGAAKPALPRSLAPFLLRSLPPFLPSRSLPASLLPTPPPPNLTFSTRTTRMKSRADLKYGATNRTICAGVAQSTHVAREGSPRRPGDCMCLFIFECKRNWPTGRSLCNSSLRRQTCHNGAQPPSSATLPAQRFFLQGGHAPGGEHEHGRGEGDGVQGCAQSQGSAAGSEGYGGHSVRATARGVRHLAVHAQKRPAIVQKGDPRENNTTMKRSLNQGPAPSMHASQNMRDGAQIGLCATPEAGCDVGCCWDFCSRMKG